MSKPVIKESLTTAAEAGRGDSPELGGAVGSVFIVPVCEEMLAVYQSAMNQRDEYNTWCVELAMTLGIKVGGFRSDQAASQYEELRERISEKISQNNRSQPHAEDNA